MTTETESKKIEFSAPSKPDILGHEFARNVWCLTVALGTKAEHLKDSRFWVNLAAMLKIGDHLEVMPQDGAWYAHLIIRNIDRTQVKTGLITFVEFEDAAVPSQDIGDFEIKWRGPKLRFGVIRKSDQAVLRENFQTKTEAVVWAAEQAHSFAA